MKKIFFFAAAMLCVTAASAKVWRINYDENANADFRTIAAACSSSKVANTDTLYCEPGSHSAPSGQNAISRNGMTVLGPGWGFEPNYGGTSTWAAAEFSYAIDIAASNVKVSGVIADFYFPTISSKVLKNVTIDRCKCKTIHNENCFNDSLINIVIERCRITERIQFGNGIQKGIYLLNNIITGSSYNTVSIASDNVKSCNIIGNTMVCSPYNSDFFRAKNSLIQDNIIINPNFAEKTFDFNQTGNIIRKNVFSLSGGATENQEIIANYPDNYYISATEANTFTCKTGSIYRQEEYYILKEGSPAKGAAYDGGDCGAFGGSTPYIICGRPQGIPYLTDVEVPAQPKDNKLTVTFKVANQNE